MSATLNLPPARGKQVEWKPVAVHGGGLLTHVSISNDGQTILTCGDVDGVYLFDEATDKWENLQEPLRGTPFNLDSKMPGTYHNVQGPTDVRVAPSNSNVIYYFAKPAGIAAAGAQCYLMRSTNRGQSFHKCAGYVNEAYANANGQQVMSGNVGGASADNFEKFQFPKIGIDPSNPDVVYVPFPGTGFKPKMTSDGGKTFSDVAGLPVQVAQTIGACAWAIDPSSAIVGGRHQRIACFMWSDGIYLSSDGGTNWTEILNTAQDFADGMFFSPDGVLFISLINDGIYRYMSGSWTELLSVTVNAHIAVHPTIAGRIAIMVPGTGFYHSTNHGTTLSGPFSTASATFTSDAPWQATHQGTSKFGVGTVRPMAWNPAITDEIWVSHNQGICRGKLNSSGFTNPWHAPVAGIEELVGNEIVHIAGKNHINLFAWDEAGFKKDKTVTGLATPPSDRTGPPVIVPWNAPLHNIWQAAVDPQNPDLVVCVGNRGSGAAALDGSGYSQDGGLSWSNFINKAPFIPGTWWYQQVCVNDGVVLWIDGHRANEQVWPFRSTDLGASAWQSLTIANFPGHSGSTPSGFGIGINVQGRLVAADSINPDVWYLMNAYTSGGALNAGTWRSTDRAQNFSFLPPGTSGAPLSNPWAANTLAYCRMLKAVPGFEGHLMACAVGTSGPTYPAAGYFFVRSTNGGETWSQLSTDILQVQAFAFGKAALGASYPTLFFAGWYKGFAGVYRVVNYDIATLVRLVGVTTGRYPNGLGAIPAIQNMEGDKDVFGRVYLCFGNHGFAYCDSD